MRDISTELDSDYYGEESQFEDDDIEVCDFCGHRINSTDDDGEPDEPLDDRICVAPSVSHCCISITDLPGHIYIYRTQRKINSANSAASVRIAVGKAYARLTPPLTSAARPVIAFSCSGVLFLTPIA